MPDNDPNPALRAELEAALKVLEPQIRGTDDIAHVSVSKALRTADEKLRDDRIRRQSLINEVLKQLDETAAAVTQLKNDGYPDLPQMQLTPELWEELKVQKADLDAAFALFEQEQAATVSVVLGEPVGKNT